MRIGPGAARPSSCTRSKSDSEQSRDRRTLFEYQLGELAELAVAAGEYEDLHDRFRRLSKGQDIQTRVGAALARARRARPNRASTTSAASRRCSPASTMRTRALASARETARHRTDAPRRNDARTAPLSRRPDSSAPDELATLEARLDRMTELARKHRVRPEMLAERHARTRRRTADALRSDRHRHRCGSAERWPTPKRAFERRGDGAVEQTPPRREEVRARRQQHIWTVSA